MAEHLDLYPAAYQKAYQVFNHVTGSHSYYEPWANGNFIDIIKRYNVASGDTIKVLSLGCGEGEKDLIVVDNLMKLYSQVDYTAFDLCEAEINHFKSQAEQNPAYKGKVNFTFIVQTEEEFRQKNPTEEYDLILCFHMLYLVPDVRECLANFYQNNLKSTGIFVVMVATGACGSMSTLAECRKLFPNKPLKTNFAEDVQAMLQTETQIKHEALEPIQGLTVLYDWFDDEKSDLGNSLLDFMCHRHEVRKHETPEVVNACLEIFRNKTSEVNGQRGLIFDIRIYILHKQ